MLGSMLNDITPPRRERDNEGFSQDRGFGREIGGETSIGAAKGDRVRQGVPGPKQLDEAGPWTNLNGGK